MSKVLTTCPFCGCGCGMLLEVENDRVLAAAPQRNHPVSRGSLCIKGWNGHQVIHNTERLTKPLVKQNGKFKEVSWNVAIDTVADNLSKTLKKHGSDAIGVVGSTKNTNEDGYVLGKFTRVVLGTNNIDTTARFFHAPTVHALTSQFNCAAGTASITDIEKADVILLVGSNAKDMSAKVGSYIMWAARNGKKLVVVDSFQTELAQIADLYLQPKPGTDVIWLNALANYLIRSNLQAANVKGVNSLAQSLENFTLEFAESNSGISGKDLSSAGNMLAAGDNVVAVFAEGLTQQASGTDAVKALANIAILLGAVGKENSGLLPLMHTNNMQGAIDQGLMPEFLPGHVAIDDKNGAKAVEQVWKTKLPKKKGLSVSEMISSASSGNVKSMFIVGENLVWSAPNNSNVQAALQNLDFLVVQDMFLTETAQLADVVLPACSFAEKDGTYTNTERRVQAVRKAIKPLGQAKPDWEIISMLGQKIGKFSQYKNAEAIFGEIADVNPLYAGLDYKIVSNIGGVQWPLDESKEGTKTLAPSNVKLAKTKYTKNSEQANDKYPFTLIIGRNHFHRMTGTMINRSFTLKKELAEGFVEVNTDDAKVLGLRTGWRAKITTARGSIERVVRVSRNVAPKTIFVAVHDKDEHTNILANDRLEKTSKIPEMQISAANLEVA